MAQFYTILTAYGRAREAAAIASGAPVNLTHMAVGDGENGGYYEPSDAQAGLKHEVWRGAINQVRTDPANPTWVVLEQVIPTDQGGFTVREVGVFDDQGGLYAVGKYPQTYKPQLAEGTAKDLLIRMILEVSNATAVTLKIDPAIVLATRKYVDDETAKHAALTNVHGATPEAAPSRLLIRDAAGRAQVAAPSAAADVARKQEVDNAKSYADIQDDAVEAVLAAHAQDGGAHGATSAATPSSVMRRDAAGRTKAAAPAAADDVARKAEVDAVATNLSTHAAAADPHGQYLKKAGTERLTITAALQQILLRSAAGNGAAGVFTSSGGNMELVAGLRWDGGGAWVVDSPDGSCCLLDVTAGGWRWYSATGQTNGQTPTWNVANNVPLMVSSGEWIGPGRVPAGKVGLYAGSAAPAGWLACNGAAVSRTAYAALFAAIGTTYGAGDGVATFNLPDLRGEFLRGLDAGRGVDSGRALGSAQADALQGHWHEVRRASPDQSVGTQGTTGGVTNGGLGVLEFAFAQAVSAKSLITDGVNGAPRVAAETRGRNVALLACIKY